MDATKETELLSAVTDIGGDTDCILQNKGGLYMIPNFNQPISAPQMPMPQMPMPPSPLADAENAKKLWDWVKESGLTPEQLDALANLKKAGKDIDALLGIQRPKSELEKLSERVDTLASAVEKLVQAWSGEGAKTE